MHSEEEISLLEALLEKHLPFYQSLDHRTRRPKTAAQRQFQDVAWGRVKPTTDHERAYAYYLSKTQKPNTLPPVADVNELSQGCLPVSHETANKWSERWVPTKGSMPRWN
jgi:uncharacterized protein YifE (UPF0438 family)